MGREIRRVPPDWEHPKRREYNSLQQRMVEDFQPMFDRPFEERAREWMDDAIAWDKGNDPAKAKHPFFWTWSGMPPDPKYYRPKWTTEPTHYQMYETVTEGTPVTPVFATKEELIEHLVTHGDDWSDGKPWSRAAAEAFVEREWAPTGVITGGQFYRPRDMTKDVLG